jgi:hypothetical protein
MVNKADSLVKMTVPTPLPAEATTTMPLSSASLKSFLYGNFISLAFFYHRAYLYNKLVRTNVILYIIDLPTDIFITDLPWRPLSTMSSIANPKAFLR